MQKIKGRNAKDHGISKKEGSMMSGEKMMEKMTAAGSAENAGNDMERYWMWLCSCPGLYRSQISGLVRYFGDPRSIYEAESRELGRWKKLADDDAMKWVNCLTDYKDTVTVTDAEQKLLTKKMKFASRYSGAFPKQLRNLPDCPYGLFYRGSLPDASRPAVAVIGARRCSSYGQQMAAIIGKALAEEGYQVISGMAVGIDGTAQAACLSSHGSSFAVLGSGADVCYPPENIRLFDHLPERGGVISEYGPGTSPLKFHFPQRNRIISALSDAILVVEARERSGSLITADLALDQGKEVYAVPGRCSDLLSYGCNRLIEQGAGIVLSKDNFLENLAVSLNLQKVIPKEEERIRRVSDDMEEDEKKVFNALDLDAKSVDEIASEAGLTLLQSMRALVGLQIKNCALEVSKNRYTRKLAS